MTGEGRPVQLDCYGGVIQNLLAELVNQRSRENFIPEYHQLSTADFIRRLKEHPLPTATSPDEWKDRRANQIIEALNRAASDGATYNYQDGLGELTSLVGGNGGYNPFSQPARPHQQQAL